MHLFSPLVQQRIQHTFAYFSGACGTTGLMMYMLRNSSLVNMNGFLLFGMSIAAMFGTKMINYE